ncbi:hypothetical protein RFI_27016 [Reticulomyxa filosa]|uniref:Peptidase A1 domain-containing protein n=1 Tax=Reticulomyxa filosa TaxID=46433 RepID=X6MA75_RETFI|nr:hypothetical protein RFI_27016 [Reticulomyxa filosa]|eukprot:ETO10362.1 hypothetical protein RFI_27016 [Reticulomyxa filosa]
MNDESITTVTKAIVDSGTSTIVGPTADVANVAKAVGATEAESGEYTVSCDTTLPDLYFTLGSGSQTRQFRLAGDTWKVKTCELDVICTCILGMIGMDIPPADDGPFWILGDVFMRDWYVFFFFSFVLFSFCDLTFNHKGLDIFLKIKKNTIFISIINLFIQLKFHY